MQSMAKVGIAGSSFRRRSDASSTAAAGLKRGASGALFISSGIPTLDAILGGGLHVGSLVMIVEDAEAPHHLLLLRNFMGQALIHSQPLLFASAAVDPRDFLGTLPAPMSSPSSAEEHLQPQRDLRIAWQYRKYFGGEKGDLQPTNGDIKDFSCEFDLRKSLDKRFLVGEHIGTTKVQDHPNLGSLFDHCSAFLSRQPKNDTNIRGPCIVVQSLCAPQCLFSDLHWEMISFIRSLKAALRASNGVAVLTFPSSVLPPAFSVRWKHLADTLLSVSAIPDEDKDLSQLLSGYQEMLGFLHVHKVAQIGSQVPAVLQARTFSLRLHRRRSLVLEPLNQAPVDGSDRSGNKELESCNGSSKTSPIDF
ncbi:paxneb protein-like protein isoform X1 [Wolffia australiana]